MNFGKLPLASMELLSREKALGMCMCVHSWTHVCLHMHLQTAVCTCVHSWTCVCLHVHLQTAVCTCIYAHTVTCMHMHVCVWVCSHIRMSRVCVPLWVSLCVCHPAFTDLHPEVCTCSWLQPHAATGKAHTTHGTRKRYHDKGLEGSVIKNIK